MKLFLRLIILLLLLGFTGAAHAANTSMAILLEGPALGAEHRLVLYDVAGEHSLSVVDRNTVEAAMAFSPAPASGWTPATLESLRQVIKSDVLLFVHQKETGAGQHAVMVRMVSASQHKQKVFAASSSELNSALKGAVSELLTGGVPTPELPTVPAVPVATPAPVTAVVAAPAAPITTAPPAPVAAPASSVASTTVTAKPATSSAQTFYYAMSGAGYGGTMGNSESSSNMGVLLDLRVGVDFESGFGLQWQGLQPLDFDKELQHLLYFGYTFRHKEAFKFTGEKELSYKFRQFVGVFVVGSHGLQIGDTVGLTWNIHLPIKKSAWAADFGALVFYNSDASTFFLAGTGGVSYTY